MNKIFLMLAALLAVGCGVSNVAAVDEGEGLEVEEGELSSTAYTFVTVRRDPRKCASPYCGGYWVRDVNVSASVPEVYVSELTYVNGSISAIGRDQIATAGDNELVLRARLGAIDRKTNTRKLVVRDAYRGLPGQRVASFERVFQARRVVTACRPNQSCPQFEVRALNGPARWTSAHRLDVVAPPQVSVEWLREAMLDETTLVAGELVTSQKLPSPPTTALTATNVFFKLEAGWSCPVFRLARCPNDGTWTFQYSSSGCVVPAGCVEGGACIALAPPECPNGYRPVSFAAKPFACMAQVCEPEFLNVIR
jgi:hypothetical protein